MSQQNSCSCHAKAWETTDDDFMHIHDNEFHHKMRWMLQFFTVHSDWTDNAQLTMAASCIVTATCHQWCTQQSQHIGITVFTTMNCSTEIHDTCTRKLQLMKEIYYHIKPYYHSDVVATELMTGTRIAVTTSWITKLKPNNIKVLKAST